ncbi:MAG: type III-A CRISPR-associated protein Cas10/Csm1, partial [Candidatus Zixiibacteriota bacterium]
LTALKTATGWNTEAWKRPQTISGDDDICESCKRRPAMETPQEDNIPLCRQCRDDRALGRSLVKRDFVVTSLQQDLRYPLPTGSIDLTARITEAERSAHLVLNMTDHIPERNDVPCVTLPRNTCVPLKDNDSVQEFEDIAAQADGAPYLAYLKMDIDNLGFIFSHGLKAGGVNISRLSTLSRLVDYFFAGYLRSLLEKEFPATYTVFSGGDDLFLIGPWNSVFDLALRIRQDFRRFTCDNPAWGLSAGIALSKPKTPLTHGRAAVEQRLAAAKEVPGKDRVTSLGVTLPWPEFEQALTQAKQLAAWTEQGIIGASQLRRLYHYGQILQRFQQTGNTGLLTVIPQMIYDFTRNWQDKSEDQRRAKQWAHAFTNPEHPQIHLLGFMTQYAIYKNRKG